MESKFSINEETNVNLTSKSLEYIKEVAKWAKFFAVIGYFGIGLMVLVSVILMVVLPTLNQDLGGSGFAGKIESITFGIIYLILALLYIYPIITLHSFANKTNQAIKNKDEKLLEDGFRKLKQHFTYVGRLVIISFVINLLVFFVMLIGGFIPN